MKAVALLVVLFVASAAAHWPSGMRGHGHGHNSNSGHGHGGRRGRGGRGHRGHGHHGHGHGGHGHSHGGHGHDHDHDEYRPDSWYIQRSEDYLQTVAWHLVHNITGLGPALLPFVDAPKFRRTALPTTLGGVQDAPITAVDTIFLTFIMDPLVEYTLNITRFTTSRANDTVTVAGDAKGRGMRASGKVYVQEARFTLEYSSDFLVVRFTEFLDGFATACYIGKIPAEVCEANGIASSSL